MERPEQRAGAVVNEDPGESNPARSQAQSLSAGEPRTSRPRRMTSPGTITRGPQWGRSRLSPPGDGRAGRAGPVTTPARGRANVLLDRDRPLGDTGQDGRPGTGNSAFAPGPDPRDEHEPKFNCPARQAHADGDPVVAGLTTTRPSGPRRQGRLAWGRVTRQPYAIRAAAGTVPLAPSTSAGSSAGRYVAWTSGWVRNVVNTLISSWEWCRAWSRHKVVNRWFAT